MFIFKLILTSLWRKVDSSQENLLFFSQKNEYEISKVLPLKSILKLKLSFDHSSSSFDLANVYFFCLPNVIDVVMCTICNEHMHCNIEQIIHTLNFYYQINAQWAQIKLLILYFDIDQIFNEQLKLLLWGRLLKLTCWTLHKMLQFYIINEMIVPWCIVSTQLRCDLIENLILQLWIFITRHPILWFNQLFQTIKNRLAVASLLLH